jgi:hypothetical protein
VHRSAPHDYIERQQYGSQQKKMALKRSYSPENTFMLMGAKHPISIKNETIIQ